MDFADQIRELSHRARKQVDYLETEEATKNALVMPFIQALGYDVFDPKEVVPEFTADHGVKKGEKVDYAIVKDGSPIMLFECKAANSDLDQVQHLSQLYRYFSVTNARIGVLTNGTACYFYSDLEENNKMDERPFLEIDLLSLNEKLIPELKRTSKQDFDQNSLTEIAEELKYTKEIKKILSLQISSPTEEVVEALARSVYSGKINQKAKDYFHIVTKKAFREFVNDQITQRFESAISDNEDGHRKAGSPAEGEADPDAAAGEEEEPEIVTTEEELEAFRIVRSILRESVDHRRVEFKDYKNFANILLDGNLRRPLFRLYFNTPQKYVELFDKGKDASEKKAIESLDDVYDYADRIKSTPKAYTS